MFNGLPSVSDQQLLNNTDRIVIEDRKLTLRMLEHLHAIEYRRLHLKLGHGSMFKYCVKHQHMSEPDAVRKIRTARCVARFKQLIPLLESGDVSLTTVTMASKYIRLDNCDAIIAGIRGKSTREVQRLLAGYSPLVAVPMDRIRTIVVPVAAAPVARQGTISADGKKSSTAQTSVETEAQMPRVPAVAEVQFERRARVEFTAHEELMTKLERIRSLMSHRLPINASLDELLQFMADYVLQREDPEKREQRREARAAKTGCVEASAASGDPRHIPAALRDQIFVRDKRCAYVGPDGKRCESTHVLQIDHVKPVARGGAATTDNLRLLCAHHNRLESERLMGWSRLSHRETKTPRG